MSVRVTAVAVVALCLCAGCMSSTNPNANRTVPGPSGPADQGSPVTRQDGHASAGRDVFRFETFGNEGFWTDAARMPAGVLAAHVTPLMALELGLSIDVNALAEATRKTLADQLRSDPTGRSSALLNDPGETTQLINANAVIGLSAKGTKVGVTCALCHTITDGSAFTLSTGGSIGHREDGRTNHNLNIGALLATAANSRALFPVLQLALKANGGRTFGRAQKGLTESSTEAEVDAYLSNPTFYPVGMFDDTFDGNGDPMAITPLFRQDLAAPFGSGGEIGRLDNFSNLVYTALFDPTNLTTPGGRAFLHKLGGAAGDEIADSYVRVLNATGVKGYPFVKTPLSSSAGTEDAPIGLRVDQVKLLDLNAYLVSLRAPDGALEDARAVDAGRVLFQTRQCTECHNVDQGKRVPAVIVPMNKIFPGDRPTVLAQREAPLTPVEDTPGVFFDDKMAVVNGSLRGQPRGIALPLLLDLARKSAVLHDQSVPGLGALLDRKRGADAPHPFYVDDQTERGHLVAFLRSLTDR